MTLDLTLTPTPVGTMALYGLGPELVALALKGDHGADTVLERHLARHLGPFTTRRSDDAAGAVTRIARYFAGELLALDEQPLRVLGTEFQRRTWNMLRTLPPGSTWSYAELAARIGKPKAVRAVAAANGANPLALFIPCHRVIAADGTLWGYGGGLEMKEWLLRHEGASFTPRRPDTQEALPL